MAGGSGGTAASQAHDAYVWGLLTVYTVGPVCSRYLVGHVGKVGMYGKYRG